MDIEQVKHDFFMKHRDEHSDLFSEFIKSEDYKGDNQFDGFKEWALIKLGFYNQSEPIESPKNNGRKIITWLMLLTIMGSGLTIIVLQYWDRIVRWTIVVGEWTAGIVGLGLFLFLGARHQSTDSEHKSEIKKSVSKVHYRAERYFDGCADWMSLSQSFGSNGGVGIAIQIAKREKARHPESAVRVVELRDGRETGTVWSG